MVYSSQHTLTLTGYLTPPRLPSITCHNAATADSSNMPRSFVHLRGLVNVFCVTELLFIATCCPIALHPLDMQICTWIPLKKAFLEHPMESIPRLLIPFVVSVFCLLPYLFIYLLFLVVCFPS